MKNQQVIAVLGLIVALMAFFHTNAAANSDLCRIYTYCYVTCPDNEEEAEDRCVDEANQEVIENCDLVGVETICDYQNCGFIQDDRVNCFWDDDLNH